MSEYNYLLLAIPAVVGILIGLFAGGLSYKRVVLAVAQIVVKLADKPLENHEKRAAAIHMLYEKSPGLRGFFPEAMAGKFVDFVWEQIIKPAALLPLPPAPPAEPKAAEPAATDKPKT